MMKLLGHFERVRDVGTAAAGRSAGLDGHASR
jgi:hypothetical protein